MGHFIGGILIVNTDLLWTDPFPLAPWQISYGFENSFVLSLQQKCNHDGGLNGQDTNSID